MNILWTRFDACSRSGSAWRYSCPCDLTITVTNLALPAAVTLPLVDMDNPLEADRPGRAQRHLKTTGGSGRKIYLSERISRCIRPSRYTEHVVCVNAARTEIKTVVASACFTCKNRQSTLSNTSQINFTLLNTILC